MASEVKFSDWMSEGFTLYKENLVVLILTTLIAMVISGVSMGILGGPMMAGVIIVTLGLLDKRDPKPEVGNVFDGFELFWPTFLFVVVWSCISIVAFFILNAIPCLGQILSVCFNLALSTGLAFAFFLMVDKKMDFWPASMESIDIAKSNFWPLLGYVVVASILASLGAIACGIGLFVTAPLYYCMLAVAFRAMTSEDGPEGVTETVASPEEPASVPPVPAAPSASVPEPTSPSVSAPAPAPETTTPSAPAPTPTTPAAPEPTQVPPPPPEKPEDG